MNKRNVYAYVGNADQILTQRQQITPEGFLEYQRDVVNATQLQAAEAVSMLGRDSIYVNHLNEHPGLALVFVAVTEFHTLPGEQLLPTIPAFLERLTRF